MTFAFGDLCIDLLDAIHQFLKRSDFSGFHAREEVKAEHREHDHDDGDRCPERNAAALRTVWIVHGVILPVFWIFIIGVKRGFVYVRAVSGRNRGANRTRQFIAAREKFSAHVGAP
ncbi:MAG: hypothetical protein IPH10_01080 [bacterium]|nr:hypothetical protein [bacterium]